MFFNKQIAENIEMQATVAQYLAEIEHLHEQMNLDQVEIEGSQSRTCAMLTELKQSVAMEK